MGRHSALHPCELPPRHPVGPVWHQDLDATGPIHISHQAPQTPRVQQHSPNHWVRYPLVIVFGALWLVIGFALCLEDGNPTNGMIGMMLFFPLASPFIAVGWWLVDRHRVDPEHTGRRLLTICWAVTIANLLRWML